MNNLSKIMYGNCIEHHQLKIILKIKRIFKIIVKNQLVNKLHKFKLNYKIRCKIRNQPQFKFKINYKLINNNFFKKLHLKLL